MIGKEEKDVPSPDISPILIYSMDRRSSISIEG
jgi:hypothetical protein